MLVFLCNKRIKGDSLSFVFVYFVDLTKVHYAAQSRSWSPFTVKAYEVLYAVSLHAVYRD